MAVCCSFECKYFNKCIHASINNNGVHTARSYATQGSGDSHNNITEYYCGELGQYKEFKPIKEGNDNERIL